jgi:hypothetical protein
VRSLAFNIVSAGLGAAAVLIIQSCDEARAALTAPPAGASAVAPIAPSFEDIQHGVECYTFGISSTLSCVKVR